MKVFEDLINKRLKKLLIVVRNDFRGIVRTVKIAYTYANLRLVFVHLQRKLKATYDKKR